jgi:UDP-N-acetylglucosamine 1-carboxyvinyltransferase
MRIAFAMDLRKWMEEERWTPSGLADYLGVQRQSVHNWLSGMSVPNNAEVVTKLFELGGDELILFTDPTERPNIPKKNFYFDVEGGNQLHGELTIPGAKNATLPMLCAALLTEDECIFRNVPEISDVATLLDIFQYIGAEVSRDFSSKTVSVRAQNLLPEKLLECKKAKKMRATILMLGPLLARFNEVSIPLPGGCVIGARSNASHLDAFRTLGAFIEETPERITVRFSVPKYSNNTVLFSEASVTATENLALFCSGRDEEAELFFTAAELHVVATVRMLQQMGAKISGAATHSLSIHGGKHLHGGEFVIPPDGLLVGTYAIATTLTGGNVLLKNVSHRELLSFYGAFQRVGGKFELLDNALRVTTPKKLTALPKLQTAIFPGFSTDLQSPFGVLLTQCEGESMIFETLFENRLTYLQELEKMGAKVQQLNPHQARIFGPTLLRGAQVQSWDLRAGAAMVLAGLAAEGITRISNVQYIDRGYERFPENLESLGAVVRRVEE